MIDKEKAHREKFIKDFSKKRGWNPDELTTKQMFIIISQKGYKSKS